MRHCSHWMSSILVYDEFSFAHREQRLRGQTSTLGVLASFILTVCLGFRFYVFVYKVATLRPAHDGSLRTVTTPPHPLPHCPVADALPYLMAPCHSTGSALTHGIASCARHIAACACDMPKHPRGTVHSPTQPCFSACHCMTVGVMVDCQSAHGHDDDSACM